jgi:hypothetical protein
MAAKEYTPTRVGMLLLDTENGYVWTVKSKTKLIRCSEGIDIEATLTKGFVPPEWKIIDGDRLGRNLAGRGLPGVDLLSDPKGA